MSIASEQARAILVNQANRLCDKQADLPEPRRSRDYYAAELLSYVENLAAMASLSTRSVRAITELIYVAYQCGYLDAKHEGEVLS